MDSPLLPLPHDLRTLISGLVIVNNQPFKIKPRTLQHPTTSTLQIRTEYSSLLRKAAFTPGTKTIAPVYDFDFSEMIAFIQTLKEHEVKAANRNRNLVVNLVCLELGPQAAQRLVEWVKVTEVVGIEVGYVVQWCGFEGGRIKGMENVVGGCREGRKVVKALREWVAKRA